MEEQTPHHDNEYRRRYEEHKKKRQRRRRMIGGIVGICLLLVLALTAVFAGGVQMELLGEQELTLEFGTHYEEQGAYAAVRGIPIEVCAFGSVDEKTVGNYTLHYQASWLWITKSVERTVHIVDTTPPTIQLEGASEIALPFGSSYEEPGYTAIDGYDGDISDQVQISGTVDPENPGIYQLTYTVCDSEGNEASVIRRVTVEALQQPDIPVPTGKVIYLTFDDGPTKYTHQLLQVLEKYNVKATFFLVNTGYNMDTLMNEIVAGGHSIGIHSMSHRYDKIYRSDSAFLEDLYGMQAIIKEKTGVETTLMRFPGGSSNGISKKYCTGIMSRLTETVTQLGFSYFDWNVDSNDAGGAKTADEVYQNVISGIGNKTTAVVLQHDLYDYSVEAVERIIVWGLENGYSFHGLTSASPTCHHKVNN